MSQEDIRVETLQALAHYTSQVLKNGTLGAVVAAIADGDGDRQEIVHEVIDTLQELRGGQPFAEDGVEFDYLCDVLNDLILEYALLLQRHTPAEKISLVND